MSASMTPVDSGLLLAKHMEEDDLRFAARLSETRRLLAMFTLESGPCKIRPALVLLSDLRLYIAPRKALRGRYVKFNIALNDVVEVAVIKRQSGYYVAIVSFMEAADRLKRAALVAQDLLQKEFVQLLISSGLLLNLGRAQRDQMRWHLPEAFVTIPTETPTWRSALVLQYRAFCDALRIAPSPSVLNALINDPVDVFDPIRLLETSRPLVADLKAVCLAARNCTRFTSVKVENGSGLNDDAIQCIALALGLHNNIGAVTISDVPFGSAGLEALAAAFDSHEGPVRLSELTLYRSHISLPSVRLLFAALPPLMKVDLASCGLGAAAVAHLCSKLSPGALRHLNLSNAACGRAGSLALATFLAASTALRYLIVIGAQLHTKPVVDAIVANVVLPLRGLNLSQNALPKAACLFLAEYLSRANALRELVLANVKAAPADLGIVLSASVNNPVPPDADGALKLDLSGCEVGSAPSLLFAMVQRRTQVMQSRLHVLDLTDCKLGYQGLAKVLWAALHIQSLETLVLSGNARPALFHKGAVELRDVLAQVVRSSGVRRLVLSGCSGGGRALPSAVFVPMFEALALAPGLQSLNIAGHRLNEATFLILTAALRTNRGLLYLDVDRNCSSFRSLTALSESIRYNETLCDVFVDDDLARLRRHTAKTAAAIADTIRVRMQLNRRRRRGERDSVGGGHDPVAFVAKDARLQAPTSYRPGGADDPGAPISCPQFGMEAEACDIVPCPGYDPGLPGVLLSLQAMLVANDGLATEGLFRVAPDARLQADVKKALDDGQDASGLNPTATCAANLVKIWFRQLPNRILAPAIDLFAAKGNDVTLGEALNLLSPRSQCILLWLLDVCALVAGSTASNKMTPRSLAIVFAPNLINDDVASGGDPLDGLRRSQEVAVCMEAWILERVRRGRETGPSADSDDVEIASIPYSVPCRKFASLPPPPRSSVASHDTMRS